MKLLISIILSGLFYSVALSTPTKLIVRAKAKDAKFIGSSIGGAKIIIRDVVSGEVLSQGLTEGSTGNTQLIIREPHKRYTPITDEATAKFETTIDLEEPLLIEVEAIAPFNQKQASVSASTQLWLIPGKDIVGEGLILEIPGFVVNILSPQTHESISIENQNLTIRANVVMMCGCTISEGGLWDSNKIEVEATIGRSGKIIETIPMEITEKVNTFEADLEFSEAGLYQITVSAYQKETGNTGVDKVNFIVR
ncbi:MAG: hypothetical protein AAF363_05290 [Bacteroidota bacterium]